MDTRDHAEKFALKWNWKQKYTASSKQSFEKTSSICTSFSKIRLRELEENSFGLKSASLILLIQDINGSLIPRRNVWKVISVKGTVFLFMILMNGIIQTEKDVEVILFYKLIV